MKDATKAIEQAIIKDIKSGVYNVGVNQTYSVKDSKFNCYCFDNKENIVLQKKTERLLYFNGFNCIFKLQIGKLNGRWKKL